MLELDSTKRPSAEEVLKHKWFSDMDKSRELIEIPHTLIHNLETYQGIEKLKKIVRMYIGTQLSEHEVGEMAKIFNQMDENHDGRLSPEEFTKSLEKFRDHDELMALMKGMDLDKSGYIVYSEFLAAAMPASLFLSIEKLEQAFRILDKVKIFHKFIERQSGNQSFSVIELQQVIGKTNSVKEEVYRELIEKADANHDGRIDYSEFITFMTGIESSTASFSKDPQ